MIAIDIKEDCTGCYACVNACPQQCITMQVDYEGFWYPRVDSGDCVHCGLCLQACPVISGGILCEEDKGMPNAYAAYSRDDNIRLQSSSGGIFTLLAEAVLDAGGVVFGACFDDGFNVVHGFAEHWDELEGLRGSKYVQSRIGFIYREVKEFLEEGRTVLFTGTPCQVAGLKRYLRKEYNNLFSQDLICHGVPSPKVWREYIAFREHCAGARVRKIAFRKKDNGWRQFSVSFVFQNGANYSENLDKDLYMRAFLKNVCLRPSCYACRFKTIRRVSDITLADFWGVWDILPEIYDDKGISLVVVHSQKGQQLVDAIRERAVLMPVELQGVLGYNTAMIRSVSIHPNRDEFFKQLDTERIDRLIRRYCKDSFGTRLKSFVRPVLVKLKLLDVAKRMMRLS